VNEVARAVSHGISAGQIDNLAVDYPVSSELRADRDTGDAMRRTSFEIRFLCASCVPTPLIRAKLRQPQPTSANYLSRDNS
jgi:hypothetical protein